jgi:hypothetical protein
VLATGLLTLAACSSGGAKSTVARSPTTAALSAPTPTTALPTTTTATTTTTPTTTTVPPPTTSTTPTTSLTVAPAGALTPGQWRPVGLVVNGRPTLSATLVQGRPGGPLSGVVRINATVSRPVLYAGSAEPGGTWPAQGAVGAASRAGLVAAFNGGFHTYSSAGGWFDHGRTAVPLRAGAASLVIRADGSAAVGMWGRDASLTSDVISVRQNLGLLIDGGVNLGGGGYWGAVLGGGTHTWRSGLGVDANGNLLYGGGPGLDAGSLAQVLIQTGAIRAMQLDINPQWVSFSYYTGGGSGSDLVPGMFYGPSHWLSGSSRDFIAVFTR